MYFDVVCVFYLRTGKISVEPIDLSTFVFFSFFIFHSQVIFTFFFLSLVSFAIVCLLLFESNFSFVCRKLSTRCIYNNDFIFIGTQTGNKTFIYDSKQHDMTENVVETVEKFEGIVFDLPKYTTATKNAKNKRNRALFTEFIYK